MQLQPKRQPGRVDRKAAVYAAEIARLRCAGFTYEAIREALTEVGVALSTTTLRREVRRQIRREVRHEPRPVGTRPDAHSPAAPLPARFTESTAADSQSHSPSPPAESRAEPITSHGLDLAEAFFKANPGNVLVNSKEIP